MSDRVRILYVDDYALDRELVQDALEQEHDGFQVTVVGTRAEFEAALAQQTYDVVLSDFNILGFHGLQVLELVHTHNTDLPVIIITGTGSEEIAVAAIKHGAADYVIKTPQHIRRLPLSIQAALATAQMQQAHRQAQAEIEQLNRELEQRVAERTQALHAAQERLLEQERLALLGRLAGGVAHELRNPLGVIINAVYYLRLLLPQASGPVQDYLGILETESHTAARIINELLNYADLQSSEQEAVAVADVMHRLFQQFQLPPTITLTLNLAPGLPKVWADPYQLELALDKLIVNACQAMPKGGRLRVASGVQGAEVWLTVQDTGVGIPPANIPQLFEPFFSTKTRGIGLGLAITKKLIEHNGGRITVESEPEAGSIFTVYLPVHEVSDHEP